MPRTMMGSNVGSTHIACTGFGRRRNRFQLNFKAPWLTNYIDIGQPKKKSSYGGQNPPSLLERQSICRHEWIRPASDTSRPNGTALPRLPPASIRVSYDKPLNEAGDATYKYELENINEKPKVSFGKSVSVIEIPASNEYCDELRNNMWNDPEETKRDIVRNLNEFLWDSPRKNWRICAEEEDMVVYRGELLHYYSFWAATGKEPLYLWFTRLRTKHFLAKKIARLSDERDNR